MSEADAVPEHATTVDNDARVAQAAADLGVEVPDGFILTGMDDAGQHTAFMLGNASALRISTAILRRDVVLGAFEGPAGDFAFDDTMVGSSPSGWEQAVKEFSQRGFDGAGESAGGKMPPGR